MLRTLLILGAPWAALLAGWGAACAEPRPQSVPVTVTVTVWGDWVAPSPGMTRDQTMRAAKDSARALAVEQAAGVAVGAVGLYEAGLERVHFLQTLARGHIVREDVVRWENKNFALAETDTPLTGYRVHLKAEVRPMPPPADPGFTVDAKLNRTAFQQGDEAVLELSSRRPAWVYVFNLMANDKAALLLPNRWQPDHRLQGGGKPLVFPAKDCGVCLEMEPLPGDPESAEAFLVVAFPKETSLAERFEVGREYDLTELYRRLTAFPLETAAMKMLPYTVKAKR